MSLYIDSTSTLHSALDLSPHPAQSQSLLFNQALQDWLSANMNRTTTFKWCPLHSNIWQNDCVDYLAKHQTTLHDTAPIVTIGYAKVCIVKDIMDTWTQQSMGPPYTSGNFLHITFKGKPIFSHPKHSGGSSLLMRLFCTGSLTIKSKDS